MVENIKKNQLGLQSGYMKKLKGYRKPIVVAHKGLDLPEKDFTIPP